MSTDTTSLNVATAAPRHRAAIWTLLVLAPVIAEVLSGSTRLSILFVLVPEIMVWGIGALLCRELVRRWRGGAVSLLMLGLALSVAEEFLIQQTSLAPLPFPGANAAYGRMWGVNWLYFLFMLGFESVWVVLVPVQVTELIFPRHRARPWLRKRGIVASCIFFFLGCRIAWYGWTQQARPRLHAADYHPPLVAIALGVLAILLLVGAARLLRGYGHSAVAGSRSAVSPWLIGVAAFIFGGAWFELIGLLFSPHPPSAASLPFAVGLVWALAAFLIFRYWTAAPGWGDWHRWALSFGAMLGCMALADVSSAGWTPSDLLGKYVFQFTGIVGMLLLARTMGRRRSAEQQPAPETTQT